MKNKATTNIKIKRRNKEQGTDTPQKAHPTGKFVIVAKFGGHVSRHSASRLANVIRQGDREGDRLKSNFFKNSYLSFFSCCTVLCTISGFSNVRAV